MGSSFPALDIRPQPSPLEQAGQAIQLKALLGQTAMQPGQLTLQNQQIQAQKRQLDDQQARTNALKEWSDSPGSLPISELPRLIIKHGGSADAALQMQQSIVDQQTKLATLDKDKLANVKSKVDAEAAASNSVLSLDPSLRPAAWQLKQKELVANGIIKPEDVQPYDEDMVKLHAAAGMSVKDQLDTALKARETAAQELKAQTEKQRLEFEQTGGAPPEKRELNDWLSKNPGKGPSDFLVWKAQHSPTMLMQGNFGSAGDPMVDMVGQNRVDLATALQRIPPASKANFMAQLNAKYPNYNQGQFGIEKKVGEEFTSGDAAKNLTAFNTAIEHATQAGEAAKALQTGDMRTLNKIGNALGYEFGSDRTTNFNVIKSALSSEISKVFKGGQATDAEIKEVQGPFDAANSPAQLRGAIKTAIRLMNSKRDALKSQYEAGRQGKPNFGESAPAAGLKVGQTVSVKGKQLKVTAVHPDGSFDAE